MWPFTRRAEQSGQAGNPQQEPARWPRLATEETYGQVLEASANLNLVVSTFSLGIMRPPDDSYAVPGLSLLLPPGATIDFADPEYGFPGWEDPPEERVLELWADDLLTVSHGTAWRFLIDSAEPFDREWVEAMFPSNPSERDFIPARALVLAHFDGLREGEFAMAELDSVPMTLTYLKDRRVL
ncbi:hypothetical protein [Rhodococcus artemisiae]|uniref:Uncharacterized protein n=1 Tax=Rhodococcus artemisiae TaxID=714159 RepID=A0ABU7LJ13_9NOCA|nr:hypothetical protein [Rhodococcus artemisiae]MEE2061545.1 hypothetical protein [Rhodococcus artemisiae]